MKLKMDRKYRAFALAAALAFLLLGTAWGVTQGGVIREGGIPGRSGLSFRDLQYRFNDLSVLISNGTGQNVIFGGTMVFLDRHRRPVARAELLPQRIKRRSSLRYRGVFTVGSGEDAASASWLLWELNQRNN